MSDFEKLQKGYTIYITMEKLAEMLELIHRAGIIVKIRPMGEKFSVGFCYE